MTTTLDHAIAWLVAAHLMQRMLSMATTHFPDLHTQAGARWLARFVPVFLFVILMALVMLVYPHVTG